jgi:hypothetical protein
MATPFLKVSSKTYAHIASRGLIASFTARVIRYVYRGTADEYNWNHAANRAAWQHHRMREVK